LCLLISFKNPAGHAYLLVTVPGELCQVHH
jgi:hypothetical protein